VEEWTGAYRLGRGVRVGGSAARSLPLREFLEVEDRSKERDEDGSDVGVMGGAGWVAMKVSRGDGLCCGSGWDVTVGERDVPDDHYYCRMRDSVERRAGVQSRCSGRHSSHCYWGSRRSLTYIQIPSSAKPLSTQCHSPSPETLLPGFKNALVILGGGVGGLSSSSRSGLAGGEGDGDLSTFSNPLLRPSLHPPRPTSTSRFCIGVIVLGMTGVTCLISASI